MSILFRGSGDLLEVSLNSLPFRRVVEIDSLTKVLGELLLRELSMRWKNMGGNATDFLLPRLFVKDSLDFKMDEMIFYGGTFNPWHEGHLACLTLTQKENIMVIPDKNPWKGDSTVDPWSEYIVLSKLLSNHPYAIYPGFLSMKDSNPTINWMKRNLVKSKSLLIGDDNFLQIKKWKSSKELLNLLTTLYVAPRTAPIPLLFKMRDELKQEFLNLQIEILGDHPFRHLSSSAIRNSKGS